MSGDTDLIKTHDSLDWGVTEVQWRTYFLQSRPDKLRYVYAIHLNLYRTFV